ncbi:ankyrin repeat domain-containing protein 26-like [Mesocricetus auratus]|uniref:Ankyrin repeat domain-containing protein 26-like n=1 Tax=Mesocricetus auratus TaxID=10036 RepID=A0ABM2Y6G0_MESAU|nr:ankyrin repeat domain-containing protein 26-like [Mesocricetus auratus]
MEDFDDLTQSSETSSEYGKFPCSNYEATLKLIEHLSLECKDPGSLLKIRDTIHSYKRLIQLKDSHCKALAGKLGTMENEVTGLHKKLSEAEHEKIKQEQELSNLRFALKQEEEKRKNADWVYEKIKEQLREKEEQNNQEVNMKQKLEIRVRELDLELKSVRNNLNKFQEALDQHIEPGECVKKMQDCIQKLGLENCKLKAITRKQAEKIEQLKKNQLSEILNDDLTAKLETASSKCQHLHKENELLQQELLSMKTAQKKCEKLKQHKKKLEQEIVNLKSHMEKNMIECDQIEQYKREIEEKTKQALAEKLKQVNLFLQTQAAYEDKLEELRHKQNASVRTEMELRIRDLESEFSKMKSQVDCNQIEMENYKQLYLEEVKIRKSLSNKLSITDERLAKVKTKLLLERKQNRALQYSTIDTRSVLESTCQRDLSNRIFIPRSFSGENLMVPTSNVWHSIETTENCKTKVLQEWEQSITRELRQATAESGLNKTSSLEFTHM